MSSKGDCVNITIAELPEVLTAEHISDHLHLTKQCIYDLMMLSPSIGGIPSFKIGRSRRAYKSDYVVWLEAKREALKS